LREEGGGTDVQAWAVSDWRGKGGAAAVAAALGWRGVGPEMRRRGEAGDLCWAGPAWDARGRPSRAGASARAENRGGEKRKNFPFSFSKQIFQKHFKFKFQFSLKFLINTKHSQNNMQQHVCITCS